METIALDHIITVSNYRSIYPADHIAGLADSMDRYGFKAEFAVTVINTGALHIKDRLPVYALVKGHCRTMAAREAKLTAIPCHVTTESDDKLLALDQLSENEARLDPSDMDRARGYQAALDSGASLSDLYAAIGKRQYTEFVERRVALLKLTEDIQDLVAKKHLSIKYAYALTVLDSNRQRIAVQAYNKAKSPNLEAFQEMINKLYEAQIKENNQGNFFALFSVEEIERQTEQMAGEISETKVSIKHLLAELEAERKARKMDREYARSKYAAAMQEIANLKSQLYTVEQAA